MRLMLTRCPSLRAWTLPLAAALLGLTFTARAAQTPPAAADKAKATTNAAPAELELPKSVFIIPTNYAEGKDPFFPLSKRLDPAPTAPSHADECRPGRRAIRAIGPQGHLRCG